MDASQSTAAPSKPAVGGASHVPEELWVDRYRPRVFFDLLSDEVTNRDTLRRARSAACQQSILQGSEGWSDMRTHGSPVRTTYLSGASPKPRVHTRREVLHTRQQNRKLPSYEKWLVVRGSRVEIRKMPHAGQVLPHQTCHAWCRAHRCCLAVSWACMQVAQGLGRLRVWCGACCERPCRRASQRSRGGRPACAARAAHPAPLRRAGCAKLGMTIQGLPLATSVSVHVRRVHMAGYPRRCSGCHQPCVCACPPAE